MIKFIRFLPTLIHDLLKIFQRPFFPEPGSEGDCSPRLDHCVEPEPGFGAGHVGIDRLRTGFYHREME